jgi:hypothetical protein
MAPETAHIGAASMRIYVFKSASTERLRAFASDPDVNNLPRQHGPWVITGAIAPGAYDVAVEDHIIN